LRIAATGDAPTLHAAGDPAAIGRALGVAGREAAHRHLVPSAAWAACRAFVGSDRLTALEAAARAHTPAALAEVAGLAEGLALPFPEVFAWMCRGDLPGVLWSAPPDAGAEGCTTVAWRDGAGGGVLGHNEDGDPALRDSVFLARIAPDDAPAFTAFCYPGSLPGHAFSWTDAGLVMTINNIRAARPGLGVPRILRARAALAAPTLAHARAVLKTGPVAGAFHHLLARPGEGLLGLETAAEGSARDPGAPAFAHANHALWSRPADQIVTPSSGARQARADALVAARLARDDPARVLDDRADPDHPIRRSDPADPDGEITLGRMTARLAPDRLSIDAVLFKSA
jgi:hypothetical protein